MEVRYLCSPSFGNLIKEFSEKIKLCIESWFGRKILEESYPVINKIKITLKLRDFM